MFQQLNELLYIYSSVAVGKVLTTGLYIVQWLQYENAIIHLDIFNGYILGKLPLARSEDFSHEPTKFIFLSNQKRLFLNMVKKHPVPIKYNPTKAG